MLRKQLTRSMSTRMIASLAGLSLLAIPAAGLTEDATQKENQNPQLTQDQYDSQFDTAQSEPELKSNYSSEDEFIPMGVDESKLYTADNNRSWRDLRGNQVAQAGTSDQPEVIGYVVAVEGTGRTTQEGQAANKNQMDKSQKAVSQNDREKNKDVDFESATNAEFESEGGNDLILSDSGIDRQPAATSQEPWQRQIQNVRAEQRGVDVEESTATNAYTTARPEAQRVQTNSAQKKGTEQQPLELSDADIDQDQQPSRLEFLIPAPGSESQVSQNKDESGTWNEEGMQEAERSPNTNFDHEEELAMNEDTGLRNQAQMTGRYDREQTRGYEATTSDHGRQLNIRNAPDQLQPKPFAFIIPADEVNKIHSRNTGNELIDTGDSDQVFVMYMQPDGITGAQTANLFRSHPIIHSSGESEPQNEVSSVWAERRRGQNTSSDEAMSANSSTDEEVAQSQEMDY